MREHKKYMNRCYALAHLALIEGESPVGSIVVKDGIIIGEAYEKSRQLKDISKHAEVLAILDALKNNNDLSGSILYSNLEPCLLCSYVIRHHKIAEVVFEKPSGELGGAGGLFNLLTSDQFRSWDTPPVITVYKED
jgi:tRNA(Arg) A34 adenosine deaminase TadA